MEEQKASGIDVDPRYDSSQRQGHPEEEPCGLIRYNIAGRLVECSGYMIPIEKPIEGSNFTKYCTVCRYAR